MIDLNLNPSKKDLRTFGLLLLAFLAFIGWMVFRRTGSIPIFGAFGAVGLAMAALGIAAPTALRPVFIGWMIAAYPIGFVVAHLVMAAVFYFVVTPIGVIMRWLGRDPMKRMFDREAATYWTARPVERKPRDYFRQF